MKTKRPLSVFVGLLLGVAAAHAAGIKNSKHNLSATGAGTAAAKSDTEVCIFCHTPHSAAGSAPLWNRFESGATYIPYKSSTLKALVGQPTGDSKLCLSCHDGTVALGMVRSRPAGITMKNDLRLLPAGSKNLGTDLSDDHPVSFKYDEALASADGELQSPPKSKVKGVHLDAAGNVQCTSCHDVHNPQFEHFLVVDNTASALCLACHNKKNWSTSSHGTSTKMWNKLDTNPWPHTTNQTSVAANGCENCHNPHNAGGKQRLLNYALEEQNCYPCHNGNVANKNIQAEFRKPSVHPIDFSTAVHDPMERALVPSGATRHVECVDCHNPHASLTLTNVAPVATGALNGVRGISATGGEIRSVVNEYEVCFRCHADTAKGPATVGRQSTQINTRLQFQTANTSFHPVEAPGKNADCPSLVVPWTVSSLIYCTDCHNNNTGPKAGGAGPNGPHGSSYAPLLERNLTCTDGPESPTAYALCYKCHDRNATGRGILQNASFPLHSKHVVDQRTACTTCHDSHGVATAPHLINFRTTGAGAVTAANGIIQYISTGTRKGNCTLICHGSTHINRSY